MRLSQKELCGSGCGSRFYYTETRLAKEFTSELFVLENYD